MEVSDLGRGCCPATLATAFGSKRFGTQSERLLVCQIWFVKYGNMYEDPTTTSGDMSYRILNTVPDADEGKHTGRGERSAKRVRQ